VLISAAVGRSAGAVNDASRHLSLITTERVVQEARRRIELGLKRPALLVVLDALLDAIAVVTMVDLEPLLAECETTLRDAVASRNGSTRDAHVLALAWAVDCDVWTTDRDFAGTGIATWSTPNLMRALAETASRAARP
jgi:predicted nucleic acid-binding protein